MKKSQFRALSRRACRAVRPRLEELENRLAPAIVGTPNQQFVAQMYLDLLKRPAAAGGLATWTTLLDQGVSRSQVVALIQSSTEYHTIEIQRLYTDLLHRSAGPIGLAGDLSFLQQGGLIE